MLTEDGKHLYVSYDEYHSLIEKLALKVYQSGWEFDTILCLARGGLRPGDILSRIFDKPLAIMSTSSYRAEAGTVQGHLDIARFITTPKGEIAGRVLLVDDFDTDEAVRNPDTVQKNWDWWEKALYGTRDTAIKTLIIFCGNIIARDCCVVRAGEAATASAISSIRFKALKSRQQITSASAINLSAKSL